jgi:hypothetical protein
VGLTTHQTQQSRQEIRGNGLNFPLKPPILMIDL